MKHIEHARRTAWMFINEARLARIRVMGFYLFPSTLHFSLGRYLIVVA